MAAAKGATAVLGAQEAQTGKASPLFAEKTGYLYSITAGVWIQLKICYKILSFFSAPAYGSDVCRAEKKKVEILPLLCRRFMIKYSEIL